MVRRMTVMREECAMSKEFDEYIADKPEAKLATKEEISLLKIKLGKSHRKESDWEVIKDIFQKRNFITYNSTKKINGIKLIENVVPSENGYLIVFTNIDDCIKHIHERLRWEALQGDVQISVLSSRDVWEIANKHGMDILIDYNGRGDSRCILYSHEEEMLKAVLFGA